MLVLISYSYRALNLRLTSSVVATSMRTSQFLSPVLAVMVAATPMLLEVDNSDGNSPLPTALERSATLIICSVEH